MLFHTDEDRNFVLGRLKEDPRLARYGAAMDHASSTDLGLWGDGTRLRADCAEIMTAEVRKYALGRGDRMLAGQLLPDQVGSTQAFQAAYHAARQGPDAAITSVLRHIGRHAGNLDLQAAVSGHEQDAAVASPEPYEAIYWELVGRERPRERPSQSPVSWGRWALSVSAHHRTSPS